MIILDTDHVSILQWDGEPAERLRQRLVDASDDWIGVTAITLEEQARGIISRLGQCRTTTEQPKYYARLSSTFRFFGQWKFADFGDEPAKQFDALRKVCRSVGSSDLKIASIALVNDALLLTANSRDYEKVPGLRFENWLP
ncbi:MAG: type II toxin-antitoxin system VapC family toxin [Planctomycetales bacterium]|nr:type II toxin-antitoxin system VapC family toxin [Planctomycetales bacterium]